MAKEEEVIDALARFSGRYGPHQTALYEVMSTDEDAQTCEAKDDDGIEYLIRLAPIITAGQSLKLIPTEGKKILAGRLEDTGDWFVLWAEQWKKITYTIGGCVLESDGTKWTVKNNVANLLDVLTNIIESVEVVTVLYGNNPDFTKLEQAKTLLNNLLQ